MCVFNIYFLGADNYWATLPIPPPVINMGGDTPPPPPSPGIATANGQRSYPIMSFVSDVLGYCDELQQEFESQNGTGPGNRIKKIAVRLYEIHPRNYSYYKPLRDCFLSCFVRFPIRVNC